MKTPTYESQRYYLMVLITYLGPNLPLFLKSRGKIGYVNGAITSLNMGDPGFDKWDQENPLVMSWLLHSMILEIGEGFLSLDTTKDVWDTIFETYARRGNLAQVYDLQRSVNRLDQAELTSLQYYSALIPC